MKIADMHNCGKYQIFLTGSQRTIERVVREYEGKYYVYFYGEMIEVRHAMQNYVTVERY